LLKNPTHIKTVIVSTAALTMALLTGCSSKPDVPDVARGVEAIFECSPFKITDVKKTDGAGLSDGQYQVAFTFQAEVKGGKTGAATYFSNLFKTEDALERARNERNRLPFESRADSDKQVKQLEKQTQDLRGGECESIQTSYLVQSLVEGTRAKLKAGPGPITVPYLAKMQGVVTMTKAESGWLISNITQMNWTEVLESEPLPFERIAAPAPDSASGTRTISGILKVGNQDSCLEVNDGKSTKCYVFLSDGPIAKVIFASCKDGDKCAMTGAFDDAKEQIGTIAAATVVR
jgi:hypothetical protein